MKTHLIIGFSILLIGLAAGPAPLSGIVVSDTPEAHETTPGVQIFQLDHDGVGKASVNFDDGFVGTCTASLLARGEGRFAILAGHCVGDGVDFAVTSVDVTWELPGEIISATAVAAESQIHIHPTYTANDFDVFKGNDVALLEFPEPVSPAVPRYKLYEGSEELDATRVIFVGYGLTGHGSTGSLPGTDGIKRYGLNRWESIGLGALGAPLILRNETQLTFDFDSGLVENDAFGIFFGTAGTGPLGGDPIYDDPAGFETDEISAGVGDSGGPAFIRHGNVYEIAGVASYGTRLVDDSGTILTEPPTDPPGSTSSDVDTTFNSSWGEFFVHSRLSHQSNKAFLSSILEEVELEIFSDGFEAGNTTSWTSTVGGS